MKKIFLILIIITVVAQGCRYEEGPVISLASVRSRLMGSWRVTEFNCEGTDSLQFYNDSCGCEVEFIDRRDYDGRDGVLFRLCHNNKNYNTFHARFELFNNKKIISISFAEYPLSYWGVYKNFGPILTDCDWEILRLTKDELKISSNVDDRNYRLSFEKK